MDSLPLEFALANIPLLAVFGLTVPSAASSPTGNQPSLAQPILEPKPLSPPPPVLTSNTSLNVPLQNPSLSSAPAVIVETPQLATTPFAASLRKALSDVLNAKGANVSGKPANNGADVVWPDLVTDVDRENTFRSGFNVKFLEKTHIFALQKPRSLAPPQPNQPQNHSPLSPLTRSSSLYPDGIMTPQWFTKYRYNVPSVILAFHELYERDPSSPTKHVKDPLGGFGMGSGKIGNVEREKDNNVVSQILELKKLVQDRGTRVCVCLVVKKSNVDDELIQDRIGGIRKAANLESRNVFAVSTNTDVSEFCVNLQRYLVDPSIKFYHALSQKMKKKRSKISSSSPGSISPTKGYGFSSKNVATPLNESSQQVQSYPLSAQGWTIRYEIKLSAIAEMRWEWESALRHYNVAYNQLMDYLSSATLPGSDSQPGPGTIAVFSKRWYEGKVLLDSVAAKIYRINLQLGQPETSITQFNSHIQKVSSLPDGPSSPYFNIIAFTYYEWLSRHHKLFADLIDIAHNRYGLSLPYPPPLFLQYQGSLGPSGMSRTGSANSIIGMAGNIGGTSSFLDFAASGSFGGFGMMGRGGGPAKVIQHPGFWYYKAAKINAKRKEVWRQLEKALPTTTIPPFLTHVIASAQSISSSVSAVTIELLSRAYEHFKTHKQPRMTLLIATEIADEHVENQNYDFALKFWERVGKSYRKEKWGSVVGLIDSKMRKVAKLKGMWTKWIEGAVEGLASDVTTDPKESENLQNELLHVLTTVSPTEKANSMIEIDMDQINSFVSANFQFHKQNGYVHTPSLFQITLTSSESSPPSPLEFSKLEVEFSDEKLNMVIHHRVDTNAGKVTGRLGGKKLEYISLETQSGFHRNSTMEADLTINKNTKKIIEGTIMPAESMDLKVLSITLTLQPPSSLWQVNLVYKISERPKSEGMGVELSTLRREWVVLTEAKSLKVKNLDGFGEYSELRVLKRHSRLSLKPEHAVPALLDELYPLSLKVKSDEEEPVFAIVEVDVEIEMETDGAIIVDEQSQSTLSSGPELVSPAAQVLTSVTTPVSAVHGGSKRAVIIGNVNPGEVVVKQIWLKCKGTPGERVVGLSLHYVPLRSISVALQSPTQSISPSTILSHSDLTSKSETLRIPFTTPFESTFQITRMPPKVESSSLSKFRILTPRNRIERYVIAVELKSVSPRDVMVLGVSVNQDDGKGQNGVVVTVSEIAGIPKDEAIVWKPGSSSTYIINATIAIPSGTKIDRTVSLGKMTVKWKRCIDGDGGKPSNTTISIPNLELPDDGIVVGLDHPYTATHLSPFPCTYTVTNTSMTTYSLILSFEPTVADTVVYSGYKQVKITLLPLDEHVLKVNMVPIATGWVECPRLKILIESGGIQVEEGGERKSVGWEKDKSGGGSTQGKELLWDKGFGVNGSGSGKGSRVFVKPKYGNSGGEVGR
ncbi:Gryzun, putative trafficking through golgi-domain-containing protein [Paraphysoderma sedebokerense]|nr:Gryzun, putative trafficking through golgi-domain-containing protein [Paraphysoderma sedebokerense]